MVPEFRPCCAKVPWPAAVPAPCGSNVVIWLPATFFWARAEPLPLTMATARARPAVKFFIHVTVILDLLELLATKIVCRLPLNISLSSKVKSAGEFDHRRKKNLSPTIESLFFHNHSCDRRLHLTKPSEDR